MVGTIEPQADGTRGVDRPECPAAVLHADRPVAVELVEDSSVEVAGDVLDVADAAHPAGGIRGRTGQCRGQGGPVADIRWTAGHRSLRRGQCEQVHVRVMQSRQERPAVRVEDLVAGGDRQSDPDLDDPVVDDAYVEHPTGKLGASDDDAAHGGGSPSPPSTAAVSAPDVGASPCAVRLVGGATGTAPTSASTTQPSGLRTAAAEGTTGCGGRVAATTSAIATSQSTPPPSAGAVMARPAAARPVSGSAIASPTNTGVAAAVQATRPAAAATSSPKPTRSPARPAAVIDTHVVPSATAASA